MNINKIFANTHSVIDNSIYMKSWSSRSKYITIIKCLKIQGLSDFDLEK